MPIKAIEEMNAIAEGHESKVDTEKMASKPALQKVVQAGDIFNCSFTCV